MKSLLRYVVSLAFSAIDETNGIATNPKVKPISQMTGAKSTVPVPLAIPADEINRPIPKGQPLPVGAVTTIDSPNVETLGGDISFSSAEAIQLDVSNQDVAKGETLVKDQDLPHDNLSLIRGLDPYSITRLNERGIVNFAQVASLKPDEIEVIETDFDLPGCFNRFSWCYQAEQLDQERE
mgnify:FL=1